MNSVFIVSGGVKFACSKGFGCLEKSVLSWLNGRTVEQLNSSIFIKFFNISTIKLKNLFTTHYSQFTKKLFAFTLAETLIVMGVIGVVAALTLPNLNQSTNNKEKVAKLQKIYQNLSDAFGRTEAIYGALRFWPASDCWSSKMNSRMEEFLKFSKKCTGSSDQSCSFGRTILKKLNGTQYASAYDYTENFGSENYVLSDGSAIYISRVSDGRITDSSLSASPLAESPLYLVLVDIDGKKGTSTMGRDVFEFAIVPSGVYPVGTQQDKFGKDNSALSSNCFSTGLGCAGWVIENGNMDYLKCPNDLSWTKTTCK